MNRIKSLGSLIVDGPTFRLGGEDYVITEISFYFLKSNWWHRLKVELLKRNRLDRTVVKF